MDQQTDTEGRMAHFNKCALLGTAFDIFAAAVRNEAN